MKKSKKRQKVKILSYAIFQTIIMAFAGVIGGLIYSVGGTFYDLLTTGTTSYGTLLAYIAIPVMPIYFAIFGFITGVAGASLYNLFSGWLGRFDMNFEKKK